MSPEWLPEMAMLLAGVIALGVALRLLFTGQLGQAAKVGAAGTILLVGTWVLGQSEWLHRPKPPSWWLPPKPPVLVLSPAGDSLVSDPEATTSVSLRLGGVLVRVAPSDSYVLSVEGERFLTLDSLRSGLTVTCDVAALGPIARGSRTRTLGAHIARNVIWDRGADIQLSKPDRHTLLLVERGEEIFRARYAGPRHVEVTGRFFVGGQDGQAMVSFADGIRWPGGRLRSGTTIDLRAQGLGKIDFKRSGLVQIQPEGS